MASGPLDERAKPKLGITQREGTTIYSGVPTDLWPDALLGDSHPVHAAKVGLEAVSATVSTLMKAEKDMRVDDVPSAGPELMRVGFPLLEKAAVTIGQTLDNLANARKTAEAAVESALRVKEPALGTEIRAHLKSMKSPYGELLNAIQAGDLEPVAAALHGPAMLSGITKEQQSDLRALAAQTFAPEPWKTIQDTDKAADRLTRANVFLVDYTRKSKARWMPSSQAANALAELMARKGEAKAV